MHPPASSRVYLTPVTACSGRTGARLATLLALSLTVLLAACTRSAPAAPAPAAKLLVSDEGLYAVDLEALRAARLGWSEVEPDQLRLRRGTDDVPLWIEGQGDELRLYFYGRGGEGRYSREAAYWLERAAPTEQSASDLRPPPRRAPAGAAAQAHYTATRHFEQNTRYEPQRTDGDRWLWHRLPAPRTVTVTATLSAVAPGPAELQLRAWGRTEDSDRAVDHRWQVAVNGRRVHEDGWDGAGSHVLTATLPAGLLADGANTITIRAPGVPGVAADITALDALTLRYPRRTVAENDRLMVDGTNGALQATGFSGPLVALDVTDPDRPTPVAVRQGEDDEPSTVDDGSSSVDDDGSIVIATRAGHRYALVGPEGVRSVDAIQRAQWSPDLQAGGAAYVVIGPEALLPAVAPLVEHHVATGLSTATVPLGAIYDQLGDGVPDPAAVRAFLVQASARWQPPPQLVLLVGDASYDPLGHTAPPAANQLPTFLIDTRYGGETASDVKMAQLDDDGLPDIALGRLPARTPAQVETYVDKALAYARAPQGGDWATRALAVADGSDPRFVGDAEAFVDRLPAGLAPQLVAPAAGASGTADELRRQIEQGVLLLAYFGHGSLDRWGRDGLFTGADARQLENGQRLPIVLNLTCLTGLFTHPTADSLAETLLWQPDGGAVAVLAPTSLTLPDDQHFLSTGLLDALAAQPDGRLGELVLAAWRAAPADGGAREVMQTFLLFGDPALRIPALAGDT